MNTLCKHCGQPVEPSNDTETRYVHSVSWGRSCGSEWATYAEPKERNYGHYENWSQNTSTCVICWCMVESKRKVYHSEYHYEQNPRDSRLFKED